MLKKLGNYGLFLLSESFLSLGLGLFTPFLYIFLQDFGGSPEQFGFSIGILLLAAGITSYFAGKHSDRIGRKIFLVVGGLVLSGTVFAYTIITSLVQLYVLQIINGIVSSIQLTAGTSFLGDITKKATRGKDVGKYHALIQIMAAIAIMLGGVIVGQLGFKIIFYIAGIIMFVSTLFLLYIKE
ncbi:MAG: MFS transporter [Candidatus Aenigmatarchaeota archaeon]